MTTAAPTSTIRTVPLSDMVLDFTLYPRHAIDGVNKKALVEALRSGSILPPVLLDRDSLRVIDGFHRHAAYTTVYGPDVAIDALLRPFASEREMFEEAIRSNIGRGVDLSPWDLMRCAELGEKWGIAPVRIAELAHWKPERFLEYQRSRQAHSLTGGTVALKRSLRHKVGRYLTETQMVAAEKVDGMPARYHIDQIIRLIESDLLDTQSDSLYGRVEYLVEIATPWLTAYAAKPPEDDT